MTWIIDAGHGVKTPGKRSPDGRLIEGVRNRLIAKALVAELTRRGIPARLLIDTDDDTPLKERRRQIGIACAMSTTGCRSLSIHHNAAPGKGWSSANGAVVFIAKNAPEPMHLNALRLLHNYCPKTEISTARGIRRANFAMVYNLPCPAYLIECGFMTHKSEVNRMMADDFPTLAAQGLADGIEAIG